EEFGDTRLPALKMKNVNVSELFESLSAASQRQQVLFNSDRSSYTTASTSYGFRYQGQVSDDTIWNFYVEKPTFPERTIPKICRFYSLAPYLERGTSVDDITTAIKTGAKMLGE